MDESGLELWSQPVFCMKTGEVNHHELLLRMNEGDEVLSPGSFLSHIENSGLMSKVDSWVLTEGIEVAKTMPVAINLSGRSISEHDFGPWIEEQIKGSKVEPKNLRFEITESAAIQNLAAARKLVTLIRNLGCLVSLDDFGTGYGSFTYLKNLQVDEIKIDMSFIRDLTTDRGSQQVVNSLITVARNFSLKTVAEGIEDSETEERVKDLGIDLGQGYLLGRPAPLRGITAR